LGGWFTTLGGGTFRDLSVNNAPATLPTTATFTPTVFGGAACILDGASTISSPDSAALDLTLNGTLALWVNFVSITSNPFLMGKSGSAGSNVNSEYRWELFGGTLYLTLGNGASAFTQVGVAWSPSSNVWYRMMVAWNGTTTTFYQNGLILGSGQAQGSYSTGTQTVALQIGNDTVYDNSGTRGINGKVFDAMLWNRTLTAAEAWADFDPETRWDLYRKTTKDGPYTSAAAFTGDEEGLTHSFVTNW
jgi:hypothetical protein